MTCPEAPLTCHRKIKQYAKNFECVNIPASNILYDDLAGCVINDYSLHTQSHQYKTPLPH
jgi:hypothetical protein